ncbi:MAG: sigma-70 family RNA polymerase sigma factor [Firmicutes bacterium]|nr:sigma-70 family RNA polymerase sigma factor [Bacillota bacterium]
MQTDRYGVQVEHAKQDPAAMQMLLEAFEPLLWHEANRYAGRIEREELHAEAQLAFLEAVHAFEGTRYFPVWVKERVHARLRNWARRKSFEPVGCLPEQVDPQATAAFRRILWDELFQSLNAHERAAVRAFLEGQSSASLAKATQVSPSAVDRWRWRAFALLRQQLQTPADFIDPNAL